MLFDLQKIESAFQIKLESLGFIEGQSNSVGLRVNRRVRNKLCTGKDLGLEQETTGETAKLWTP
jgi:hypothetical protein